MSKQIITTISDAYIYLIAGWIDQIRSDQSQSIGKDQIRSDHVGSPGAPVGDWRSWLLGFCESEGISVEGKDLGDLERSVGWLRKNWDKVRTPRAYISKIISNAPEKLLEIVNTVDNSPDKKEKVSLESTDIMGIPIEEIHEAVSRITDDNYVDLLDCLPRGSRRLWLDRSSVFGTEFKLNIMAAYGIKAGVL